MKKVNGVWGVNNSTISTANDLFGSNTGGSTVPHGHLHPDFGSLTGKTLSFSYYYNGKLLSQKIGPILSNLYNPSDPDMNRAGDQRKTNAINGTFRNIIVTSTGISFYNADSWFKIK